MARTGICGLYSAEPVEFTSRELTASREPGGPLTARVAWCRHKHSPCTEWDVRHLSNFHRLGCLGQLERCEVPADLFDDQDD